MSLRPRVGVIGGTFDPIHLGHLAAARAAHDALALDRVTFIPAARPPHRPDSPHASEYHRMEMIRRATAPHAGWEVSDLELRRHGPSYTWDTLASLHASGLDASQIFFIIGSDAFAEIATWYRFPDILSSAHFVVITRSGSGIAEVWERVPMAEARVMTPADVDKTATPGVIPLVVETPAVSSTEIRARAARGESITHLVPAAVAAYIDAQQLYNTTPHSGK